MSIFGLLKNGVPIPNTTARITVDQFSTGTVVTQDLLVLNQNDKVSVGFAASAPTYGLISSAKKPQYTGNREHCI